MKDALKWIYSAPRITVCVDSVDDRIMCGRFYSGHFAEPFEFRGITCMLMRMNALFDELEFPRMGFELRSISPIKKRENEHGTPLSDRKEYHTPQELEVFRGELLTFYVQVFFRQNATWQGEFRWMEGHCTERFRSALELIVLMTEAMEERGKMNDAI